jgi:hypothetical protein
VTLVIVIITMLSLFLVFCVKQVFIRLLAIKLFFDSTVFLVVALRTEAQLPTLLQAAGWLLSSLGLVAVFLFLAVGARHYLRNKKTIGTQGVAGE